MRPILSDIYLDIRLVRSYIRIIDVLRRGINWLQVDLMKRAFRSRTEIIFRGDGKELELAMGNVTNSAKPDGKGARLRCMTAKKEAFSELR